MTLTLELVTGFQLPIGPPLLTVERQVGCTLVRLRRSDMDLCWDERTGSGSGRVCPDPLSLRGLVQLCLATLLPTRGGLALHAASLVRAGVAYLFPGASGSGKSTLVRRSGGQPALSDEISLLCCSPGGGSFSAFPSPFWSRGPGSPPRPAPPCGAGFPLESVSLIEHSPRPWRRPMSPGAAVDALLEHCLVYGADAALAQAVLDRVVTLCEQTPVQRLGMPLGPSVWDLLAIDAPWRPPCPLPTQP